VERRKVCKLAAADPEAAKKHDTHPFRLKFRASRALPGSLERIDLPAIKADGVNDLPWVVVSDTQLDRSFRPTFPRYLRELDGKRVRLTGYMQPLGEGSEVAGFLLIEFPVGCWYCEMPELTHMVLVEMPEGKAARYSRERIRVTGKLKLNATDPENFLYLVQDAQVTAEKGD